MIKQPSVNLRYEAPKIQDYYATLLKKLMPDDVVFILKFLFLFFYDLTIVI